MIRDQTIFKYVFKIFSLKEFIDGKGNKDEGGLSTSKPKTKFTENGNSADFNDNDYFPMVQFVRNKRLYYLVMKQEIEYSYMDIKNEEVALE
jgi:hypothetical protein